MADIQMDIQQGSEDEYNNEHQDFPLHSGLQTADSILSEPDGSDLVNDELDAQERQGLLETKIRSMNVEGSQKISDLKRENQLNYARKLLYFSHLFDQFSEGTWQFCLVLFLAAFSNYESLVLVSTYG